MIQNYCSIFLQGRMSINRKIVKDYQRISVKIISESELDKDRKYRYIFAIRKMNKRIGRINVNAKYDDSVLRGK